MNLEDFYKLKEDAFTVTLELNKDTILKDTGVKIQNLILQVNKNINITIETDQMQKVSIVGNDEPCSIHFTKNNHHIDISKKNVHLKIHELRKLVVRGANRLNFSYDMTRCHILETDSMNFNSSPTKLCHTLELWYPQKHLFLRQEDIPKVEDLFIQTKNIQTLNIEHPYLECICFHSSASEKSYDISLNTPELISLEQNDLDASIGMHLIKRKALNKSIAIAQDTKTLELFKKFNVPCSYKEESSLKDL